MSVIQQVQFTGMFSARKKRQMQSELLEAKDPTSPDKLAQRLADRMPQLQADARMRQTMKQDPGGAVDGDIEFYEKKLKRLREILQSRQAYPLNAEERQHVEAYLLQVRENKTRLETLKDQIQETLGERPAWKRVRAYDVAAAPIAGALATGSLLIGNPFLAAYTPLAYSWVREGVTARQDAKKRVEAYKKEVQLQLQRHLDTRIHAGVFPPGTRIVVESRGVRKFWYQEVSNRLTFHGDTTGTFFTQLPKPLNQLLERMRAASKDQDPYYWRHLYKQGTLFDITLETPQEQSAQ